MKLDIDSYREIADSILRNKSRSLLTGFGIFWGLFMLLFLMGGGNGLKALLSKNFEGFASNSAIVVSQYTSLPYKGMPEGRLWNMDRKDLERTLSMVPELETVTPLIGQWGQDAVNGGNSINVSIKGTDADYIKVESPQMKYGRYINNIDVEEERKVCVIGKRIYNELFPEGGDPCGTFIKVGAVYLKIIGVNFASGDMGINGNSTTSVIIPYTLAAKLYHRGDSIDIMCLVGKEGVKIKPLENKIRRVLARRHYFSPEDSESILFLNLQDIYSIIDNLFRGLNFLILLVGLGTLLAGAIGVSNIMMVTVKERTIEIGIRRAIGATPRDILSQIIMESIALTMAAGSIGIVFSVLILNLLEIITRNQVGFQINFWIAVAAVLLLTLLGVVAGLAPARRAMDIKPVDAMRDE